MFSSKVVLSLAVASMASSTSAEIVDGITKADCWADEDCSVTLDRDNGCILPSATWPFYDSAGNFIGVGPTSFSMGTSFCGNRKQVMPVDYTEEQKAQAMQDAINFCFDIGAKSACIWGKCDLGPDMCKRKITGDGDPHFQTWSGEYFDFHGACDLKFIESQRHNVTINVRTTQRYLYSYISSAVLELNGETFELGSYGDAIINGVSLGGNVALPKTLGGAKMIKAVDDDFTHTYSIFLDNDGTSVQLKTFKDMVGVKLFGSASSWSDSVGLMGSSITGEKLARDGKTVMEDSNAFGQEWQVREDEKMLFQAVREPQAPVQCILPDTSNSVRRLGETIAREAAEEACKNWGMNKAACIADVLATGDLETAKNMF